MNSPNVSTPHQHVPRLVLSRQVLERVHGTGPIARFNTWLAVKVTKTVGSMWMAYVFAALTLISLPAAIASGQLELAKRFLGMCGQLSREAKGACIRIAIRHRQLGFADLIIEGEYNPDLLCAAVHMAVLTKDTSHVLSLLRRRQRYTDLGASCLPEGTAL